MKTPQIAKENLECPETQKSLFLVVRFGEGGRKRQDFLNPCARCLTLFPRVILHLPAILYMPTRGNAFGVLSSLPQAFNLSAICLASEVMPVLCLI